MADNTTDPTKERLLIEAEKLFGEKGFDAVSVREITAAADTNTAAVNYHFGSKQNLYLEVFRQRAIPRATHNMHMIQALEEREDIDLRTIIETMLLSFLTGPLSDTELRTVHTKLIHKELDRPTEAIELLLEHVVKPFYSTMTKLLRRAAPGMTQQEATLCTMSIFGQMVFFSHVHPMIRVLLGDNKMPREEGLKLLVRHITDFSLHGITNRGIDPCES